MSDKDSESVGELVDVTDKDCEAVDEGLPVSDEVSEVLGVGDDDDVSVHDREFESEKVCVPDAVRVADTVVVREAEVDAE